MPTRSSSSERNKEPPAWAQLVPRTYKFANAMKFVLEIGCDHEVWMHRRGSWQSSWEEEGLRIHGWLWASKESSKRPPKDCKCGVSSEIWWSSKKGRGTWARWREKCGRRAQAIKCRRIGCGWGSFGPSRGDSLETQLSSTKLALSIIRCVSSSVHSAFALGTRERVASLRWSISIHRSTSDFCLGEVSLQDWDFSRSFPHSRVALNME